MKKQTKKHADHLWGLFPVGLAAAFVLAVLEVRTAWVSEPISDGAPDPLVTAAMGAFVLPAVLGLIALVRAYRYPGETGRLFEKVHRIPLARWIAAAVLLLLIEWAYLIADWGAVLAGPWMQFLLAIGFAGLLARLFRPRRSRPIDGDDLLLVFYLFLYPRVVLDARLYFPDERVLWALILAGIVLLLLLVAVLYHGPAEKMRPVLLRWREQSGRARWLLIAVLFATPLIICYGVSTGFYILCPNIRFAAVLTALLLAAYLLCRDTDRLVSLESIGLSGGVLVLVSAITRSLLVVVDDPFSLSWSEGNRLYDYSLVFAQNLYDYKGTIPDPYNTPGRYGLWGVLYLWPGLPIWAHRLWNVALLTLPSFLLAWFLTRTLRFSRLRIGLFVWITAFFIILAPLHPPFIIAAIVVAAFTFHPSLAVRGASLVAASVYVGISRWTWVFAPGVWGALTDLLLYYPARKGAWFQRLWPTALMALLGVLPSFLLNLGNLFGYSSGQLGTAQQPLLWYRLLPNSTLGSGILPLALWTTGPLLALLVYIMKTRQWQLDAVQILAIWGALFVFMAVGLTISTKIGGGGDLHNLDIYLVSLIFVIVCWFSAQSRGTASSKRLPMDRWPIWALASVCWLLILPAHPFTPFSPGAGSHAWLDFPQQKESDKVLKVVRSEVEDAVQRGEVLFMDQRQLLTFGYVRDVPFVPEFEKKYMMDQALASNAAYFQPYYRDLAAKRFALILTEPLKTDIKGGEGQFSEENDLWVTWVSAPTLCYYKPIMTDRIVDVQLLVPRANPTGCEKFTQQDSP
jgi:hypothetical protein